MIISGCPDPQGSFKMARTDVKNDVPAEEPTTVARYNRNQLKELSSFDDALRLAQEVYGDIVQASAELGDGFEIVGKDEKSQFIKVPMILLSWGFGKGDHGEFVSIRAVTKDGRRVVINDGSTGIYAQLREYTDLNNRDGGMFVARGFRKSDYEYDDNGTPKPATTFYLDTAA